MNHFELVYDKNWISSLFKIFKCRIIVLYWILLFFLCFAIWLLLKVTTMPTCSPKFPDIYAIESTFSKRQMAQSIEVENLCKNLFFKKILYKKCFLLIFFLILLIKICYKKWIVNVYKNYLISSKKYFLSFGSIACSIHIHYLIVYINTWPLT